MKARWVVFGVCLVGGAVSFSATAGSPEDPAPPFLLADDFETTDSPSGQTIGHGDGLIHVIPSLSSPAVKSGDKVTISAVVKAQAGIEKVEAVIDLGNVAQPPSAVQATLTLPSPLKRERGSEAKEQPGIA